MKKKIKENIKKYSIIILIVFFFSGCSLLPRKNKCKDLIHEKVLYNHYINWEIEKGTNYIKKIENTQKNIVCLEKYKKKFILIKKQENQLKSILKEIKMKISKNDFEGIKKYVDKSVINILKFNSIKKYDFKNADILFGKPVMKDNISEVILIVTFFEETGYFNIIFKLKRGDWKIVDFNEKEVEVM